MSLITRCCLLYSTCRETQYLWELWNRNRNLSGHINITIILRNNTQVYLFEIQ